MPGPHALRGLKHPRVRLQHLRGFRRLGKQSFEVRWPGALRSEGVDSTRAALAKEVISDRALKGIGNG